MSIDDVAGGACGLALAAAVLIVLNGRLPAPRGGWTRMHAARSRRSWQQSVAALLLGAGAWWATGWPVGGVVVAAAVAGLPRVLAPTASREIARSEAVATWTRRVGDLLASGAGGLPQAITRSADTAPAPIAEPVQRLVRRMRTERTDLALRGFADELADPAADAVVLALLLRLRAGGRGLADLLHDQAQEQSEQVRARRQVEADRATPRTTVRCLIAIVLVMLAGLFLFAGHYLAPFATPAGQGVLAALAALGAGSVAWMHRLTTPPRAERVLLTTRKEVQAR